MKYLAFFLLLSLVACAHKKPVADPVLADQSIRSMVSIQVASKKSQDLHEKNVHTLNRYFKSSVPRHFGFSKVFTYFKDLDYWNKENCSGTHMKRIMNAVTGEIFTAYYSTEDDCDGGNTSGVIIKGTVLSKKNVVYMINDSYIYRIGPQDYNELFD